LDDIKALFATLAAKNYRVSSTDHDGQPLSVNLDTDDGYISIKNDLCTHIIEFALPPRDSANELISLYSDVFENIDIAAEANGLQINFGASLDVPPETITILPGHPRSEWLRTRILPDLPTQLIFRYFTSLMCATQVHLNILDQKFFQNLNRFYSMEFIFPLLFSNSKKYNGFAAHCVRPLAWEANFPERYLAKAFPKLVPLNELDYSQMLLESLGFQRDYTFLCPRSTGSVEFRSTCSQNSVEDVAGLVATRIAVTNFVNSGASIELNGRDAFYSLCLSGNLTNEHHEENIKAFLEYDHSALKSWLPHFEQILQKLRQVAA
jgi:hypothetical protein